MGTLLVKVHPVDVIIIDDDRVAQAVRRDGQFEPESLKAWGDICSDGKVGIALDVGSYGGLFGIAAALMKNNVFGFEPKPIMVRRTKANQALNGVTYPVIEAAVSDKDGKGKLGFDPSFELTATSSLIRKGPAYMPVKTMKLDSLKREILIQRIGAIKIDVEGHEAAVLSGALRLIEKHRPTMLIETLEHDERKAAVEKLLPGYRVAKFCDKRNLLMEPL